MKLLKSKMNRYKNFRNITILFLLIIFTSCASNKSIKNPYVSYYKGENTLIYYIKPKTLYSNNKNNVIIDFTFTDNKQPDSVTVNYTIDKTKSLTKPAFYLTIQDSEIKLNIAEIIFKESNGNEVKSRYSSYISKKDLLKLIASEGFSFTSKTENESIVFKMKNKEINKMKIIKIELSEILNNKLNQ